jgi:MFS family permease
MLMDISSEMIHSLLPLFMVSALGLSTTTIGFIEGIAEGTAMVVKVFSGSLSDYLGKRKWIAAFGYGLSAFTKPFFALANGVGFIFAARMMDRIGKGIRGAPRDALIADITPGAMRGAAFGLRQSLDTLGAFIGPLLAVGLMLLWANDFRRVFWIAVIPAFLAVLLIMFGVSEPDQQEKPRLGNPISRANLQRLSASYWLVVSIGAVFTLARFSDAFLILRAQQVGVPTSLVPLVMVAMNVVYAASAYPFGQWSDKVSRVKMLAWGLLVLILADLVLAAGTSWLYLALGVALWGVHMGMTQGLLAALVAATAPPDLRGTAFGLFYLISGLALFVASAAAGWLWDAYGAAFTFYAGAGFCGLTLLALFLFAKRSTVLIEPH